MGGLNFRVLYHQRHFSENSDNTFMNVCVCARARMCNMKVCTLNICCIFVCRLYKATGLFNARQYVQPLQYVRSVCLITTFTYIHASHLYSFTNSFVWRSLIYNRVFYSPVFIRADVSAAIVCPVTVFSVWTDVMRVVWHCRCSPGDVLTVSAWVNFYRPVYGCCFRYVRRQLNWDNWAGYGLPVTQSFLLCWLNMY